MGNGTQDRVYGGDPDLVHIQDGTRGTMGATLADLLDELMRAQSATDPTGKRLCPGCYMIAGLNMLVTLADRNGQSRTELARSMLEAFSLLYAYPERGLTEEIKVILDPPNFCESED